MRMKNAKRIYTIKIFDLVNRENIFNHGYPYEFMNKMTEKEVEEYLNELKKQLKQEGIPTKNINIYNNIFNSFIEEREDLYQVFKKNKYTEF